ncbi:MAG TPA: translation elongation factor Ts, partial [Gemmataceae bacterium]
ECKAALIEANGDLQKAEDILRIKGGMKAAKREGRETAEGRIATFIDPDKKVGAILELRCESPPVTKTEGFVKLANDLARQVALKDPKSVEELLAQPFVDDPKKTVQDRIGDAKMLIRENMRVVRFERLTGLLGEYVHHDGSVGVLVEVTGEKADPQLLRDVAMHITAASPTPVAARREDVPKEILDKEMEIAKAKAAATGKPPQIAEKIAEGQMRTWFQENVLVEQPFIRDDSKTVGQVLQAAGLQVVRFVRYRVGQVAKQ